MAGASLNNIVWWGIWGFAMGGGLFALKESFRNSYYFLAAMPLLTASLAAAVSRLGHEYRKAATEVKWLAMSAPVFLGCLVFVYLRAGGYGPFAKGGSQRAFLSATFGMSVPEVERALERRLIPLDAPKELPGSVNEWLFELVGTSRRVRTQYMLPDMELFGAPCQTRFDFLEGRLSRVQIEFEKVAHDAAPALAERLRAELGRDYQAVSDAPAPSPVQAGSSTVAAPAAPSPAPLVFRKGDVEARILQSRADAFSVALGVELTSLSLARGKPLRADAKVF